MPAHDVQVGVHVASVVRVVGRCVVLRGRVMQAHVCIVGMCGLCGLA